MVLIDLVDHELQIFLEREICPHNHELVINWRCWGHHRDRINAIVRRTDFELFETSNILIICEHMPLDVTFDVVDVVEKCYIRCWIRRCSGGGNVMVWLIDSVKVACNLPIVRFCPVNWLDVMWVTVTCTIYSCKQHEYKECQPLWDYELKHHFTNIIII